MRVSRLEEERISGMRVEQRASNLGMDEGSGGVVRVKISSVIVGGAVNRLILIVGIVSSSVEGEAVMRREGMNFFFRFLPLVVLGFLEGWVVVVVAEEELGAFLFEVSSSLKQERVSKAFTGERTMVGTMDEDSEEMTAGVPSGEGVLGGELFPEERELRELGGRRKLAGERPYVFLIFGELILIVRFLREIGRAHV